MLSAVSVANAGIAFSNESNDAISISSVRSENHAYYLLKINIEGIPVSNVDFKTDSQTLYLSAKKGVITKDSISGAQVVNLRFNFPANANLKNFYRENLKNQILISVPKDL